MGLEPLRWVLRVPLWLQAQAYMSPTYLLLERGRAYENKRFCHFPAALSSQTLDH